MALGSQCGSQPTVPCQKKQAAPCSMICRRCLPPPARQVLGALTGLTALDLSDFVLRQDRALPRHLSSLSGLRHLKLCRDGYWMGMAYVAGEAVAASLTCLRPLAAALTHLDLCGFGLGRIPAAVAELTALEELLLGRNPLSSGSSGGAGGWVGAPISRLTRLSHLDLSVCKLEGVPEELAALPRLQWLELMVSGAKEGGLASCTVRAPLGLILRSSPQTLPALLHLVLA